MLPAIKPLRIAAVAAASLAMLAACAPDAVRNVQAKDFNAYLDKLTTACPNMVMGSSNISEWLRTSGDSDDSNYVYWLDQTSRLYYQRISVKQYRDSISAALGGRSDAPALDCIVRNLPAERPTRVPGSRL
ncbi:MULTISPECIES: hypothetical protein [Cupriavidus]|uniref:hypothetical protein n=1 Tax=Cupriavidus TaxID=106589 RepID=UPI000366511E|nr:MULTISPECIES: hypothetical protein [Cupriavidus]MDQ0138663.1 hypothetical protein [Cupriavidus necator]UIF90442.1 hypothetical protein KAF44_42800 [Cupriavidus necator]